MRLVRHLVGMVMNWHFVTSNRRIALYRPDGVVVWSIYRRAGLWYEKAPAEDAGAFTSAPGNRVRSCNQSRRSVSAASDGGNPS